MKNLAWLVTLMTVLAFPALSQAEDGGDFSQYVQSDSASNRHQERINLAKGEVLNTFQDLVVPGQGGFDIVFSRINGGAPFIDFQLSDYGNFCKSGKYYKQDISTNPTITFASGKKERLYYHSKKRWVTHSNWEVNCTNGKLYVYSPNGRYYQFDNKKGLVKFGDTNGNYATVSHHYYTAPQEPQYNRSNHPDIDGHYPYKISTKDGRTIDFTYNDSGRFKLNHTSSNDVGHLKSLSHEGQIVNYSYTDYSVATAHYGSEKIKKLSKVTLGDQKSWKLSYYKERYCTHGGDINRSQKYDRCHRWSVFSSEEHKGGLLKTLTNPTGGVITYDYGNNSQCGTYLKSKSKNTGEKWTYSYANCGKKTNKITTVNHPDGSKHRYEYYIKSNIGYGDHWKASKLISHTIENSKGEQVQRTEYTWDKQVGFSNQRYNRNKAGKFVQRPILTARTVMKNIYHKDKPPTLSLSDHPLWHQNPEQLLAMFHESQEKSLVPIMNGGITFFVPANIHDELDEMFADYIPDDTPDPVYGKYITRYSNHTDKGYPQDIHETGPYGDNRYTSIAYTSYQQGVSGDKPTPHILAQKESVVINAGDAHESTLSNEFDSNGRLKTSNDNGFETSYTYDKYGNVYKVTSPGTENKSQQRVVKYSNYEYGIAKTETHPEGVTITRTVNTDGWLASQTDAAGYTTSYEYDALGRVTQKTLPNGNYLEFTYSANNRKVTVTKYASIGTTLTAKTTLDYDQWARLTTRNVNGVSQYTAYDTHGRVKFKSRPGLSRYGTQYTYNALGQPISVVNTDKINPGIDTSIGAGTAETKNSTISYRYDSYGRVYIKDEEGRQTYYDYRSYGDPNEKHQIKVTPPDRSAIVTVERDSRDRIISITQDGVTRSYEYDARDAVIKETGPEHGDITYKRDIYGQIEHKAVDNMITARYEYDLLNRLTAIRYQNGSSDTTQYAYDQRGNIETSTVSSNGSSNTTTFSYNALGQLEQEQTEIDGLTFTTAHHFDDIDRLQSTDYPDYFSNNGSSNIVCKGCPGNVRPQGRISYTYNDKFRLEKVEGFAEVSKYHADGAMHTLKYTNGVTQTLGLDTRRRIKSQVIKNRSGSKLYSASYQYDGTGNLLSVNRLGTVNDKAMTYDSINRLTAASGPWGSGSINYDARGNITSKTMGSESISYSNNHSTNRLDGTSGSVTRTFQYDSRGNVTHNGQDAFTYNQAGDMTCVNCGTANAIHYWYNADNMRIKRYKNGQSTYYVYTSDGQLRAEYTPVKGAYKKHIYLGNKRIATREQTDPDFDIDNDGIVDATEIGEQSSETVYESVEYTFHNVDLVDSPTISTSYDPALADNDAMQGQVVCEVDYQPYGGQVENDACPEDDVDYGGKLKDQDTGLSYFHARYYDAAIGRFMAIDPIRTDIGNIHHVNRYNYANNNPYKFVDPTGMMSVSGMFDAVGDQAPQSYDDSGVDWGINTGGGGSGGIQASSGGYANYDDAATGFYDEVYGRLTRHKYDTSRYEFGVGHYKVGELVFNTPIIKGANPVTSKFPGGVIIDNLTVSGYLPPGVELSGISHTHPGTDPGAYLFSGHDIANGVEMNERGGESYIGTSDGFIGKFDGDATPETIRGTPRRRD